MQEVDVADGARGFLDVGLKVIDGVVELGVALAHHGGQTPCEQASLALVEGAELLFESAEYALVAGEIAQVEKADVQLEVLLV
jgi:hypothetical protein